MKRRWGDRRDGALIRDLDSMHYIMPLMYPNRCDNEAYLSEVIDLTEANRFLAEKNAQGSAYKYNLFQLVLTATVKTLTLRPKMNRFIANYNMYQRNEITAAFTIKKIFSDNGGEALARITAKPTDTLDTIHEQIYQQISFCRGEGNVDASTGAMDAIQRLPLFLKKLIGALARWADKRGLMPRSIVETDPYQTSCVLSNVGSIGLHAGYHHLTNWGTTSVFVLIGQIAKRKLLQPDGSELLHDTVDLGLTIDERIADGYYYAKTVKLLKKLLENPALLELPLETEVEL
ncbi:MAG: 2-oxo acid dehydrogenase subunit E2 [bacterium]